MFFNSIRFPFLKKSQLYIQSIRNKSFAEKMSEALQKVECLNEIKETEREKTVEKVKTIKALKKYAKKRKWVEYSPREQTDIASNKCEAADRIKRKKSAILIGYSGVNYFGMQRNPGMSTIEEELFKVMLKHKWITEDGFEQSQNACFQRAARTDKGVSAARQVCSIKLPDNLDIKSINEDLPEQIRIFTVQRVTKGFNSKDQCNARTYSYMLPTISFANYQKQYDSKSYRIDLNTLEKLKEILTTYEGTKNFHNFTSKKNYHDPSAKRYIISFTYLEPFLSPHGSEFIKLIVKGQSFMLHQIRKMVGLAIAIVRGNTTVSTLDRAFTQEKLDLPMAPGLGLVLDTVHYDRYNERYGKDGLHEPLDWKKYETEINEFVEKYIDVNIYETEYKEHSMMEWLDTLHRHSYDVRRDVAVEN
ncbi:tRNA pseudouridine synthase A [Teleopsis dalmanni]|uniref:tRNA pseudouridine synthase A n=1 Tax=Teleopsis dalmanni TaxID=139649 RepID=UPI0018CFA849|nr:tRNA pseudouridine synthase A [Teleopsis dalmanni]